MLFQELSDIGTYETWYAKHPEATLWQSLEWRTYQEALGHETKLFVLMEHEAIVASALVIIDRTALQLETWDIPRGPICRDQHCFEEVVDKVLSEAKNSKCMSVTLSPVSEYSHPTFKNAHRTVQPEATRILDLIPSEEEILAQMKQKGRYNIRVAEKHGVYTEESKDIDAFYELLTSTSERDAFGVHGKKHYETFLKNLPDAFLLLAYAPDTQKKPIAGLIGTIWHGTGIYYYGASSHAHRALMAPYALQWAAIRHCKAHGATSYDLLGVAPENQPRHPWSGITRFKEQFGGTLHTYASEKKATLRPIVDILLRIKRRILG